MDERTRRGYSQPQQASSVISGPTSPFSVDTALGETIKVLRELEQVCFRSSRNSTAGLFFAQHRLLLSRIGFGKAVSRSEWLELASLGKKFAAEKGA